MLFTECGGQVANDKNSADNFLDRCDLTNEQTGHSEIYWGMTDGERINDVEDEMDGALLVSAPTKHRPLKYSTQKRQPAPPSVRLSSSSTGPGAADLSPELHLLAICGLVSDRPLVITGRPLPHALDQGQGLPWAPPGRGRIPGADFLAFL